MDDLNGRLVACQLLAAGLVARLANASPDPLRFVTEFRDEMHAVAAGIRIGGAEGSGRKLKMSDSSNPSTSLAKARVASKFGAGSTVWPRPMSPVIKRGTP